MPMRKWFLLSFSLVTFSSPLWASEKSPTNGAHAPINEKVLPHERSFPPRWESRSKGGHLNFGIESGFAWFQDIQAPIVSFEGERADGTPAGLENIQHFGMPVIGHLGLSYRTAALEPRVTLSVEHVSSMMDPPKAAHATYSRVDFAGGFAFRTGPYNKGQQEGFIFEADLHGRRATFGNRSASHYVDTIMPTAGMGWYQDRGFNFLATAGTSIMSKLAYDAGHSGMTGTISGSTSNVTQFGVLGSWRTDEDTVLTIGFEQERTDLTVADTGAYQAFGLVVPDEDRQAKTYSLSTNAIKLGYSRRF